MDTEIKKIRDKITDMQKNIVFESSDDEGAASYYAELQTIIDACDDPSKDLNDLLAIACDLSVRVWHAQSSYI